MGTSNVTISAPILKDVFRLCTVDVQGMEIILHQK